MRTRKLNKDAYVSPFLGIGEGKKKRAEAEAYAQRLEAERKLEEAKAQLERDNLLFKMEALRQGFNPDVEKTQLAIQEKQAEAGLQSALAKAKNLPETTLYSALAAVVAIVMAGVYFFKKK